MEQLRVADGGEEERLLHDLYSFEKRAERETRSRLAAAGDRVVRKAMTGKARYGRKEGKGGSIDRLGGSAEADVRRA